MVDDQELLKLVEGDRFLELHRIVSLEHIADTWLAWSAAAADDGWWAAMVWYDEPDEAQRLAMLFERATDAELGSVAAGPLETVASDDESRLGWLERQAARSEQFRRR